MTKKNTGIAYEKLTQQIFDQIVNQNAVQNIDVQHNVTLNGKTTDHQIDVFWNFSLNGITYQTIIQAKDWGSKVKQEHLLAFKGVLDDLPSGTLGIFVSKSGFQSGAKEYAKAHGIRLYELRKPTDEDWEGRLKRIDIDFHWQLPYCKNLRVVADKKWCDEHSINALDNRYKAIAQSSTVMVNSEGVQIGSINDWIVECFKTATAEEKTYSKLFDDAYIVVGDGTKIKISSISADIGFYEEEETMVVDAENIVATILKDLSSGTIFKFDKHNNLLGGRENE